MLVFKKQDLLKETSGLIIHGCNQSAVFNAGIARQIRNKYPKVYKSYMSLFKDYKVPELGYVQTIRINDSFYIANCITQTDYGRCYGVKYASFKAIEECLRFVLEFCELHKIILKSPKIGCGLGGLDWISEMEPIYKKLSEEYNKDIEVYSI